MADWRDNLDPALVKRLDELIADASIRTVFEAYRDALDVGPVARQKARTLVNKGMRPCGVLMHDPATGVLAGVTTEGRVVWWPKEQEGGE